MLLSMIGTRVLAYGTEIDDIYYEFYEFLNGVHNVACVSNGRNKEGDVIIPSSVTYRSTTYTVTEINALAFYECSGMTSVSIPSSIITINQTAFIGCVNLATITVDESCQSFDSRDDCNAIIEKRTNCLIVGCKSSSIPSSVTSIGKHAFDGCKGLTSISIPNSVTSIDECAFNGCNGLSSIRIPNSVTDINNSAFMDCGNLVSIEVEKGNSIYDSRDNCNAVIMKSTNSLILGCLNTIIPSSITDIGQNAFYGCFGLTSIDIPNCVTSINENAFYGCIGLESIVIPNSVTNISKSAFGGCSGLKTLSIGMSNIDTWFSGLSGLTSLTLTDGVKNIGNKAFSGCNGLTSITFPNSLERIGSYSFSGCTSMASINIPNCVTSIDSYAFSGCSNLSSVTIPNSVTSLGANVFQGCHMETLIIGMTYIPSYSSDSFHYSYFPGCLTEVILLDGVTSIGDYAFSGCYKLPTISFPNSVESIGHYAFYNCNAMNNLTIPSSVTAIASDAFSGCDGLSSITIGMKDVSSFISGNKALKSVYLLDGVKTIGNNAFSKCTGLVSIDIPNSVTTIESNAFEDCSGLTAFNLPESVTNIGDGAFLNCISLDSINIPNSVTRIGACAFQNCKNLVSFEIPNSVSDIEYQTFMGCSQLSAINIPNSVSKIYARAFKDCESLTSVSLPNSITIIETEAYFGCSRLTSVEIDRSTPINIDGNTFSNRENATLFVPAGSEEAYKSAKYWMEFKAIKTLNNDVPVTGLSLDETNISLSQIGDTHQLKAIIEPSNATNKTINWNSSNFAVCTVTETGLVIAKGCGKANIVATTVDGGYTATCEVTVTQPVEALALEKHSLTLKIGETERLYVQIAPLLAGNKTVNWSSADEEVASVDSMGTVKALAAGETWIMAVSDDNPEAKDSCIVIVPDIPAPAPNGDCATPTIMVSGNKMTFECETPDAEFTSYLTTSEEFSGGEVVIENKDITFTLTVYAIAPGYDRSKPAMMKFTVKKNDVNGDGRIDVADIATILTEMAARARMQGETEE